MMKRTSFVFCLALLCSPAFAGPVFSIMGGGGIAPLHPDGNGITDKMTLSSRFGISGSGGGFIDGTLTLVDGFVLPTVLGGTATISSADIQELTYRHVQPVLSPTLFPYIDIVATAADIVSATGTIVFDSSGYRFTSASATGIIDVQTSIATAWTVPLYGSVSGDWRIQGPNLLVGNTGLGLIESNQASGAWQLTGFTSAAVPEPSSMLMLLSGMLMLGLRRQRIS